MSMAGFFRKALAHFAWVSCIFLGQTTFIDAAASRDGCDLSRRPTLCLDYPEDPCCTAKPAPQITPLTPEQTCIWLRGQIEAITLEIAELLEFQAACFKEADKDSVEDCFWGYQQDIDNARARQDEIIRRIKAECGRRNLQ